MISTDTDTTPAPTLDPHLTATEARAGRRAGRLLIAAFLAFVGAVAVMIGLLQEFNEALEEAAATSGVPLTDLTAEAIAPIYRETYPLWQALLLYAAVIGALTLFVVAIRAATRIRAQRSPLATIAATSSAVMPFAWVGLFVVERGLASSDPEAWVGAYDALYLPLIAAGTIAGSVAVITTSLLLRMMGVARWTALVVVALSALVIVMAPFTGAPPIVPLLLGAIVGIVLLRTVRSAD